LVGSKNTRIAKLRKSENAKDQKLKVFFAPSFFLISSYVADPSIPLFTDRSGRQEFEQRAATFNRAEEDKHEETWTG